MLAPARHLQPLPIAKPIALSARPVNVEAIAVLCVFVLAGLIWLAVGGALMRIGPAAPGGGKITSL